MESQENYESIGNSLEGVLEETTGEETSPTLSKGKEKKREKRTLTARKEGEAMVRVSECKRSGKMYPQIH